MRAFVSYQGCKLNYTLVSEKGQSKSIGGYANEQSGRADIRFNSDDCYGGLHCGTTMDIWLNEQWVPTRIEMDSRGWYLVGVQVETLWGQRVRICW